MRTNSFLFLVSTLLAGLSSAGEVLLHNGPTVSTPVSSMESPEKTSKELEFIKQFFIDTGLLEKLPPAIDTTASAPLGAIRAIELAGKSDDLDKSRAFVVKRLEFLTTATAKRVDFYLVEMQVNGSTEHRIVLMDGTVLKPRLKNVGK
ncbi:hypothetical protein JIN84_21015 [Luteolibacter yonseiensis]|uniref:Uncharacterized protein n=1 Tax=Luteolibacter yonseiensis TaxID=1144680 RepID=A0A934R884_9BACT|nr:hypothetical protein [Luteolibacter yonseiensis]MBK1818117.1 hypothetical protein [Luteolibacter yonseiensis]